MLFVLIRFPISNALVASFSFDMVLYHVQEFDMVTVYFTLYWLVNEKIMFIDYFDTLLK